MTTTMMMMMMRTTVREKQDGKLLTLAALPLYAFTVASRNGEHHIAFVQQEQPVLRHKRIAFSGGGDGSDVTITAHHRNQYRERERER